MHRFLVRTDSRPGEVLELGGDESHHAARVLRVEIGDRIEVLDGSGRVLSCRVLETSRRATRVVVEKELRWPPLPRVELVPSLLKGKAMDFLVQKATELGVSRLSPLVTERAVVRIREEEASSWVDGWLRTSAEACKQCGNPWLPEIRAPRTLAEFLRGRVFGEMFVASLRADARNVRELLVNSSTAGEHVTLVLGPEGDFTEAEEAALREAGAKPMSLGPLVLRAETAALAGLAVIQHELRLRPRPVGG